MSVHETTGTPQHTKSMIGNSSVSDKLEIHAGNIAKGKSGSLASMLPQCSNYYTSMRACGQPKYFSTPLISIIRKQRLLASVASEIPSQKCEGIVCFEIDVCLANEQYITHPPSANVTCAAVELMTRLLDDLPRCVFHFRSPWNLV
jgi:hypothetical protein